ncbi:MAG: DNA-directed RNA polymerase subunit N [Conexivisphaerales archaeon]|jgi:DNA-directed RNA polymerase, subunit N (EC 2.7.7.6)
MLVPIRCFTCGALVGDKFSEFRRRVDIGEDPSKVLDELGLKRYCCRRMLLSGFEIIDYQLPYYEATERRRKDLLGS